jgi:predicted dehydrogenase
MRGHYSSYKKMIERERLGAVLVATPTYTHKEICIDACKAGLHVFCEKPMALTAADCRAMIEAADKHEVRLMPGFQRRFQSIFREMKRRIEAGEIGEPRMAFAVRMGARTPPGVGGWRPIRSKGGGLFSGYCHEVDLLRWFVGEYKSVRAVANAGTFPGGEIEDHILWTFEFDNGAVGSLGASQAFGVGCYELGVAGTKASLKYDGVNRLVWCAHGQGFENIELAPNDPLVEELLYFFTCLREGTNPSPNALDGLRNLEVIEAAHKSVQTGKVVLL